MALVISSDLSTIMPDLSSSEIIMLTSMVILTIFFFFTVHHWYKPRNKAITKNAFIQKYKFPQNIRTQYIAKYQNSSISDIRKIEHTLKDYFHICNANRNVEFIMPSRAVAEYWKLFTEAKVAYNDFCNKAFGIYMYHQKAEYVIDKRFVQEGISNTFKAACVLENIAFENVIKIPRLFSLDSDIEFNHGYCYTLEKECENCFCVHGIVKNHIGDKLEFDDLVIGNIISKANL